MQPVTFTPEIAARLGLRSGAPTFGRLQCFDATPGASVRTNVWDRFATFGEGPDGVKVKDGDEVNFTPAKFKEAVENWYRRGGRLPMCLDHRSALGGYVEAQAAAKYDAMAVVSGGQVSHFRKLATSSATPPDISALKSHAMKFATEFNPDPAPDGLWGFRCEVTPKGAHPTEGLANYEGISPFFVMDGTDEQSRPVGMVIFDVAAVNANFQAGCELTMSPLNAAPTDGAKVHAMATNVTDLQVDDQVRDEKTGDTGTVTEKKPDGSVRVIWNGGARVWYYPSMSPPIQKMSAAPSGNGATTMAQTATCPLCDATVPVVAGKFEYHHGEAGGGKCSKSYGPNDGNWRTAGPSQRPSDMGPSEMSATGATTMAASHYKGERVSWTMPLSGQRLSGTVEEVQSDGMVSVRVDGTGRIKEVAPSMLETMFANTGAARRGATTMAKIYDYATGDMIRTATADEERYADENGDRGTGAVRLPTMPGRTVYVMDHATGAARRMNQGAPMNPEQMAAHFAWAPEDDDKAKLAKVCAKMAAPMPEPPAVMAADPEADSDEEKKKRKEAEKMAADHAEPDGDEAPMKEKEMARMSTFARAFGVTLSAGSSRKQALAAIEAASVPASDIPRLVDERVAHALKTERETVAMATAVKDAEALATEAVTNGYPAEKRPALVKFARDDLAGARAIVEPFIKAKGALRTFTANGNPNGVERKATDFTRGGSVKTFGAELDKETRVIMTRDKVDYSTAMDRAYEEKPHLYERN